MSRSSYISEYGLNSIVNFGKHAGKTVRQIYENNPFWLEWAYNNIKHFKLEESVKILVDYRVAELQESYLEYIIERDNYNWK